MRSYKLVASRQPVAVLCMQYLLMLTVCDSFDDYVAVESLDDKNK